MPPDTNSADRIQTARRRFFDQGDSPRGLVPETILRSWQRCAGLGFSASASPHVAPLAAPALRELCQKHEELRRICLPEIEALYADARATSSIVILTAPDGLILEALGSADFLGKAARVSLRPGVPWSENSTGTNAIGTAMVEGRAVEVRGPEHFFAPHRVLSCSAVPIIDPFGQIAGVLDLSGESSVHHTHALGMVRMAVEQIERRLFERYSPQHFGDCTILRVQRDANLFGTPQEGVLVFKNEKLAAANRHGLAALDLVRGDIGRRAFSDLFDAKLDTLKPQSSLRDAADKPIFVRVDSTHAKPPKSARAMPCPAQRNVEPILDAALDAELDRGQRVLNAGMSVLLLGETGTGKECFARALHQRMGGKTPFVAVNCAGLPESLIESELFGYEEGAFTGARRHGAKGLLREADGGVLFLDEIGDMPLSMQSRLLRVLQEREVVPLGAAKPVRVEFSVIAATNRMLDGGSPEHFRSDLFFRIADYTVRLPALREREDCSVLIRNLWNRLTWSTGTQLHADALKILSDYPWPGNFRQLTGVLRTLIAFADKKAVVLAEDIPETIRRAPPRAALEPPHEAALSDITERAMRAALDAHAGNVSAAAKSLGVSRSTLYRRLG